VGLGTEAREHASASRAHVVRIDTVEARCSRTPDEVGLTEDTHATEDAERSSPLSGGITGDVVDVEVADAGLLEAGYVCRHTLRRSTGIRFQMHSDAEPEVPCLSFDEREATVFG
jgi:hypothetical protein